MLFGVTLNSTKVNYIQFNFKKKKIKNPNKALESIRTQAAAQ